MANRLWFFWGLTLTLTSNCACEKLAGIEKKQLILSLDSGTPVTTCSASSASGIGLRVANMIPTEDKLDICIRPAGGQFPSSPLLISSGDNCPAGIAYSQYTVPLSIAPGTYDIKLVPYNSDCSNDGPLRTGIEFSATQSTSIVAFGPDATSANAKLTALRDATSASAAANVYVRFFHALYGGGILEAGLVDHSQTPPTMSLRIFRDVDYGAVAAAGNAGTVTVDDLGYMIYPSISGNVGGLPLGASHVESANTPFVYADINMLKAHRYTLFLMGASAQKAFPAKLWSCDESVTSGSFFAECGDPRAKTFGIFHPNLTDVFTDYVTKRTPAALNAIGNSTADVLCLPELYSPDLRQQLASEFPSSSGVNVVFSDNPSIPSSGNLNDQNGSAPSYADPTCSGTLQGMLLDLQNCLLAPGLDWSNGGCIAANGAGDAGLHYFAIDGTQAIGCAAKACATQVNTFLGAGSHEADACFMCAIAHLSSGESIEEMYSKCTTTNGRKPHYVYDGATGIAVLTKLPIATNADGPEVVLLPASTWNRAALRVPLVLPNNAIIDFWCASVRAPNSEVFLPNGGPYYGVADGGGENSKAGNAAEENLQIARLIAAVNGRVDSSQRRAIVAALTYASPSIIDSQGTQLITELLPENFALFQQANWSELVPANYTPLCTYCGDNPLNGGSSDKQWMEHLFGIGIGNDSATDTQRTFTSIQDLALVLYNSTDGLSIPVPVSQYYGLQSTVRVTQ